MFQQSNYQQESKFNRGSEGIGNENEIENFLKSLRSKY
jgi:hypothetical protein